MIPLPVVTITMDHMRHQMRHAFLDYTDRLEKEFEKALDKAISEFDFEAEANRLMKQEVHNIIQRAVRDELHVMAQQKVRQIMEKIDLEKGPK